jgi:hypothetical protein
MFEYSYEPQGIEDRIAQFEDSSKVIGYFNYDEGCDSVRFVNLVGASDSDKLCMTELCDEMNAFLESDHHHGW